MAFEAAETTETIPATADPEVGQLVPYFEVLEQGQHKGRFHLVQRSAVIGRDPAATLTLQARGISRRHARLMRESDGSVQLVDLGAKNGTHLNGRPVEVAALRAGDRIGIGVVELVVGFEDVLEARSGAIAESASPTGTPPRTGDSRLRKREREVAELVAEGITNAAIAERLSISPRTVSTHITKIYERLGLKSRAALTRWVVRSKLTDEPG